MKKILTILTILSLLAVIVTGFAQTTPLPPQTTPPVSLPIGSLAALRAYALTQVRSISGGLYEASVSGNYWFLTNGTFNADPERMAHAVSVQGLNFKVDPTRKLESHLTYQSSDGYGLFWGATNFHLEKSGTKWQLPTNAYNIHLKMADHIPFFIPGIEYAYMETVDESGNHKSYYNFGFDGRIIPGQGILLGRQHIGHRGRLHIGNADGTRISYDLGNGMRNPSVDVVVTGLKVSLEGCRSVPINSTNIVYRADDNLIRAQYNKNTSVKISFPPNLAKYPVSVGVIDLNVLAANPLESWVDFNPYTAPVQFNVLSNQVIMIKFEDAEPPGQLPEWNGGKG